MGDDGQTPSSEVAKEVLRDLQAQGLDRDEPPSADSVPSTKESEIDHEAESRLAVQTLGWALVSLFGARWEMRPEEREPMVSALAAVARKYGWSFLRFAPELALVSATLAYVLPRYSADKHDRNRVRSQGRRQEPVDQGTDT